MDTLLRAKHWQIFLLAFGIPWLLMFIIIGFGLADFLSMLKANPDPEDMAIVMSDFMSSMTIGILPVTLLSTTVAYGWMYAVNKRISPMALNEYKPNQFYVSLAIACIVLFTLLNAVITYYMYTNVLNGIGQIDVFETAPFGDMTPLMIGVYVISILATFVNLGLLIYVCYQLARGIKSAEVQRLLRSDETIAPFFFLFFLFVGIWFLQPIINKLHEEGPGGGDNLDRSLVLD